MTYATVDDIEIDFGPLTDTDRDKVDTLIERAEARVQQAYRDLDARIADGRTSEALVVQVVSEMVSAVLRNPGGFVSSTNSSTAGPFSQTVSGTLSTTLAGGLLRLTRAQRELLGDPPGRVRSVQVGNARPPEIYTPQVAHWWPRPW